MMTSCASLSSRRGKRVIFIALFLFSCLLLYYFAPHIKERALIVTSQGCATFIKKPQDQPPLEPPMISPDRFPTVFPDRPKYDPTTVTKETRLAAIAVHGFTTMDQLYLRNGTFYIVTSNQYGCPLLENIIPHITISPETSQFLEDVNTHPANEIRLITPQQAAYILGDRVMGIEGLSVILYDTTMMTHYYHWWGEIILGFWRAYSVLDLPKTSSLYWPSRFIIPFYQGNKWRDRADIDGPLMKSAFPSATIESRDYWNDLLKLDITIVFQRAMIISRHVTQKHPNSKIWPKMIAGLMGLDVHERFWESLRVVLVRNLVGSLPEIDEVGKIISLEHETTIRPAITYISRQNGGRRLTNDSHDSLVEALAKLEEEGVCDVRVAVMENMTLNEQVRLSATSTITIGVHGNGLTHQLWMPSSRRSTVIEIVYPGSTDFDYWMLSQNVGHKHYLVWNDTIKTINPHDKVKILDGFHDNAIPVHGEAVANLIRSLLRET
ncbi:hypothetical protein BDQ12DRAFT_395632 [Crucibulum laeve]|uniref:Glycosyltransferase 61 catalytic domain-containing protein n=1 Tax=Crucibulum laeve TaxID=68775 RepID=A0A5C3M8M1_9AGAR|nr:hypothetical protein BDQ12DRAFT_395632 [Crucibulum laeve]